MRRSRQLKDEKELKRRYGRLAESMEGYYHQLDLIEQYYYYEVLTYGYFLREAAI